MIHIICTYDEPSIDPPPATIVTDPEVIALCWNLAWAKFPILFQFPSLYSAIVDMLPAEAAVKPPMIKTLSSVEAVAYADILKIYFKPLRFQKMLLYYSGVTH